MTYTLLKDIHTHNRIAVSNCGGPLTCKGIADNEVHPAGNAPHNNSTSEGAPDDHILHHLKPGTSDGRNTTNFDVSAPADVESGDPYSNKEVVVEVGTTNSPELSDHISVSGDHDVEGRECAASGSADAGVHEM